MAAEHMLHRKLQEKVFRTDLEMRAGREENEMNLRADCGCCQGS